MVEDSQTVMQAKGFDSQLVVDTKDVTTPIDGHHVEVSATVDVPSLSRHASPRMANSLRDANALLRDNDTLVLQNHFSSFDGLEITDAGGGPNTGMPIILTTIVDINSEHITIENQVVSKFWAYPSEMGRMTVILRRKLFTLLENLGHHLRGLMNPGKLLRQFYPKSRNEGLLFFLECQRTSEPQNCGDVV